MMERNNNAYQTLLQDFLKFNVLVKCPSCGAKATVHTGNFFLSYQLTNDIKVTCMHCGFNKKAESSTTQLAFQLKNSTIAGTYYIIGAPVDPFFQIPVWLQLNAGNHLLWAYNQEHLFFLKMFVSAQIRERHHEQMHSNKSLGSRLPKWLTAAKNRDEVLKKISLLEKMVAVK